MKPTSLPRLGLAVLIIGGVSGLLGGGLSAVLHLVQHWAFGIAVSGNEGPFHLAGASRRLLAVGVVGCVIAVAWYLLRRFGRPVVGVESAVNDPGRPPPLAEGLLNALVQVVAVGGGASIGREVAPREAGALAAGRICRWLRIEPQLHRVLIACGAAAGLAAVYHVPVAGAVFALEILIGVISVRYAVLALSTSMLATVIARIAVSPEPFYHTISLDTSWHTLGWAAVVGLLIGWPAREFRRAVEWVGRHRLRGVPMLAALTATMAITGLLSMPLPEILGNGQAAAQRAYDGAGLADTLILVGIKTTLVLLTLLAGAVGGTLTPGFSVGALLGLALADLAALVMPGSNLSILAPLAAGAFLAVSMNAPFTGLMLTFGFTDQPAAGLLPLAISVSIAFGIATWLDGSRNLPHSPD